MNKAILLLVLILVLKAEDESYYLKVGEMVYGNASSETGGQSYYYLKIEEPSKKYLFFRLAPTSVQKGRMGLSV